MMTANRDTAGRVTMTTVFTKTAPDPKFVKRPRSGFKMFEDMSRNIHAETEKGTGVKPSEYDE